MKAVLALALLPTVAHADPRSITLEATSEAQHYDAERGLRLEIDLANLSGWTLGVAGAIGHDTVGVYQNYGGYGDLDVRDLEGLAFVARTAHFTGWSLRGELAVGALDTHGQGSRQEDGTWMDVTGGGVTPVIEAAARATVPISHSWAITGGPIVSYMNQWFTYIPGTHVDGTHREAELLFSLGLTYQL
ncbi:MAG: hypothetical protein QM831_12990 [Kofleriaceae bacterium]